MKITTKLGFLIFRNFLKDRIDEKTNAIKRIRLNEFLDLYLLTINTFQCERCHLCKLNGFSYTCQDCSLRNPRIAAKEYLSYHYFALTTLQKFLNILCCVDDKVLINKYSLLNLNEILIFYLVYFHLKINSRALKELELNLNDKLLIIKKKIKTNYDFSQKFDKVNCNTLFTDFIVDFCDEDKIVALYKTEDHYYDTDMSIDDSRNDESSFRQWFRYLTIPLHLNIDLTILPPIFKLFSFIKNTHVSNQVNFLMYNAEQLNAALEIITESEAMEIINDD